ncbi:MAG TPA: hypothetical protein VFL91_05200, partial [Thermomicrobiales bacterium]|nr:hypothetical protein [Thermomicrobiales bacterium]
MVAEDEAARRRFVDGRVRELLPRPETRPLVVACSALLDEEPPGEAASAYRRTACGREAEPCPRCRAPLGERTGRYGPFLGRSRRDGGAGYTDTRSIKRRRRPRPRRLQAMAAQSV